MPVLPDQDRFDTWAEFMKLLSTEREVINLNKIDLRATVDAADVWLNNNKASFKAALPAIAQANLTNAQIARLLVLLVAKRHLKGA